MPGIYAARDGIIGVQSALGGRGGLAWLLRDEFTTDLAAGSVNGTAAEPGPGTRVVTDGNSKLTISSGLLSFATGGVGAGDPGLWLDAVTRAAGRVMLAEITPANTDALAEAGWDSNQAGAVNDGIRFAASGALSVIANGGTAITVRTYTATSIPVAVAMRATGMCFFAKFSGNWLLLWRSAAGTGNGYPAVAAAGTTAIFTLAWLRSPNSLWLPTPLASDGFGSAFGTTDGLGHAEGVAGGIGSGGAGVVMSNVGATWSVSAGKAINTPTPGANLFSAGDMETGSPPTGWTATGGSSLAASATAYAGSQALEITRGSTNASALGATTAIATGVYETKAAYRTIDATYCYVSIDNFGDLAANFTTSYVQNALRTILVGSNPAFRIYIDGAAGVKVLVDSAEIKSITLSSVLSLTNAACADVMAGVAITRNPLYACGLALNWDSSTSPANGVVVQLISNKIQVVKCVAGVWSQVSSTTYTYSAGARLVVAKNGTEYRTYYNNVLVKSDTISDAGILTGTYHGLFSTDASNTLDDLVIYATGTNGEYSALNAWSA